MVLNPVFLLESFLFYSCFSLVPVVASVFLSFENELFVSLNTGPHTLDFTVYWNQGQLETNTLLPFFFLCLQTSTETAEWEDSPKYNMSLGCNNLLSKPKYVSLPAFLSSFLPFLLFSILLFDPTQLCCSYFISVNILPTRKFFYSFSVEMFHVLKLFMNL